ncbi:MAG: type II toxin-antitoxin system VapC family toxin [Chthoniobacterales bacterium]|nr:type II toxin-antitoxin system VapC family toxin [Chthoniobacterales bacterium]
MSWLLDTDVLSQPAKRQGVGKVLRWLEEERADCYTSTIVVGQLAYWVHTKSGVQRERLQTWLRRLLIGMEGRVYGFTIAVAHVWAEQQRQFDEAGVPMPIADSFIAATARRHNLTIVTGNEKDFRRPGLKVFNPFKELPAE